MKFKLQIDKNVEEVIAATVHQRTDLINQIEALILRDSGMEEITAYTEDEIVKLSFGEIECITVLENKTVAIDKNGVRYRLKYRLYETEEFLPSYFTRINKSAIANEKRIERFVVSFNGAVDVVFKSGYKDYVSRRCFQQIRRKLGI